jgi:hypothetical protein
MKRQGRQSERGYALLTIFLMAAMVALMLFMQLPRYAFENEREKEQLLIDRGEQFILAIRRYTKDYNKFPGSLRELEETNNKRYLRRLYIDPFTDKDEWRLIHSNGSQLTDSLVEKPPLVDGATQTSSSNNTQQGQPQQQVNAAVLQRSSDQILPGNEAFFQQPGQQAGQQPNGPSLIPPQGGVQVGNPQLAPQFPGQQFPGQQFPGQPAPGVGQQPGFPGQTPQPGANAQNQGKATPQGPQFQPAFPGQQFIGQQFAGQPPPPGFQIGPGGQLIPAAPGTPTGVFTNQLPGQGTQGQQQNLPGGTPLPASNQTAQNIVNQLLTGGSPARAPTTSVLSAAANNSAAAGIAGVASTHTGPSIKVYRERTKYEEWEFVYTPTAPLTGVAPGSGGAGGSGGLNGPGGRGGPDGRGGNGNGNGKSGTFGPGGIGPGGPGAGKGGGFTSGTPVPFGGGAPGGGGRAK